MILFDSDSCYMGYNKSDDTYVSGSCSDLLDLGIDINDIECDMEYCSTLQDDTINIIEQLTSSLYVESYALIGTLQFWNGTTIGGKPIATLHEMFIADVSNICIYVDDNTREIMVRYSHHDGTHYLKLFAITEELREQIGASEDEDLNTVEWYKKIYNIAKPIVYNKSTNIA